MECVDAARSAWKSHEPEKPEALNFPVVKVCGAFVIELSSILFFPDTLL